MRPAIFLVWNTHVCLLFLFILLEDLVTLDSWAVQGPDYQNSCKVTMFSTLYLKLQHESYNVPAML